MVVLVVAPLLPLLPTFVPVSLPLLLALVPVFMALLAFQTMTVLFVRMGVRMVTMLLKILSRFGMPFEPILVVGEVRMLILLLSDFLMPMPSLVPSHMIAALPPVIALSGRQPCMILLRFLFWLRMIR